METSDKEFFIKYIEEKFKNIEEKFNTIEKQTIIQAKEYERRLGELNHENARILAAQDKSVSLEKFEGTVSHIYSKIDENRKDIVVLNDFKQKSEGRGTGYKDIMDIVKLIIIIAGFFIAYFVIKK